MGSMVGNFSPGTGWAYYNSLSNSPSKNQRDQRQRMQKGAN